MSLLALIKKMCSSHLYSKKHLANFFARCMQRDQHLRESQYRCAIQNEAIKVRSEMSGMEYFLQNLQGGKKSI